jgi:uncharacterized damage-inducible protein DinB
MTLLERLLAEYDNEMALTRKSIERAPEARFGWKPHPKSPTLGWLVGFLAVLPAWTMTTFKQDSLDLAPPGGAQAPPPPPATVKEVLATFDRNAAAGRTALAAADEAALDQTWTLLLGGKVVLKATRYEVLRQSVINHLVHHRAQLGVYLRLCDVAVPMIYGPTADEAWGG